MTEIGLTAAISLAGLVFAALLARWTWTMDSGSAELRRLGGATRRAADTLLWGSHRVTMVLVGATVLVLFAIHGFVGGTNLMAGLRSGFHAALLAIAGAVGSALVASLTTHLARAGSMGGVSAARTHLDLATTTMVRATAAASLAAVSVGVFFAVILGTLVFALLGGFSGLVVEAARGTAQLVPAYAVGAAVAGLVFQKASASYRASSQVGAAIGGESQGLSNRDARNPAMVATLVGDHLIAATHAVDLHLATTLAVVVAVLLGSSAHEASGSAALALLPIVVLAFGVLASAFGTMVVRHTERESPASALWRGHAATTIITLGGLAGASIWLLEDQWWAFFAAGTIPLLTLGLVTHLGGLQLNRRLGLLREVQDSARAGTAPTITTGVGIGLQSALLPVFAVGVALSVAWQLGQGTRVPHGGVVAIGTAIMVLLAASPYILVVAMLDAVAESSLGVLAMAPSAAVGDASRHTRMLDDTGFAARLVAQPYLIVTSSLVALSTTLVLPDMASGEGAALNNVNLANPLVAWGGAMGAVVVLATAGNALRLTTRGVRNIIAEVDRQLRRFPRQHGAVAVPEDFAPSYRACIELANRHALTGLIPSVVALLALPIGVALVMLVLRMGSSVEALAAFLVAAALTGLAAALVVERSTSLLCASRRAARQRSTVSASDGQDPTAVGEALADILRPTAGTPLLLSIKVVAVVSLVVIPFLT